MDLGTGQRADIASAIDGSLVATTGSGGIDFAAMLHHARTVGGPALRKLTFHDRARIIKGLGLAILARKEELYELNYLTGATRKDGWIDIEGGAGTLLSFSSKGRRELPDAHVLLDGAVEPLSKSGSFIGQHIYSPMRAARSTSTPSTSPSGECSKSSPRPCSPACPRSSNRPARPLICAKPRCAS